MIHREFIEPNDPPWQQWRDKAKIATEQLVTRAAAGDVIGNTDINDILYKGCRDAIWKAFDGKCAYCEAKFILDQAGDVEHFRPKLGVKDENDRPVVHPGYYWLAYDWRNLLPSCAKCNRLTKTTSGKLIGKGERFPVIGRRATRPGEEPNEQPLFLNPIFDDPEQHLVLDVKTGILAGSTNRGKTTVDLLGLNREGLPEERRKIYTLVRGAISEAFAAFKYDNPQEALEKLDLLQHYLDGTEAYAWAGRKAIKDDTARLGPLFRFLAVLTKGNEAEGG